MPRLVVAALDCRAAEGDQGDPPALTTSAPGVWVGAFDLLPDALEAAGAAASRGAHVGLHAGADPSVEPDLAALQMAASARPGEVLTSAHGIGLLEAALPTDWSLDLLDPARRADLQPPKPVGRLSRRGPRPLPPPPPPSNLWDGFPCWAGPFVGRSAERNELLRRILDGGLISLVGGAGSGKSRLAAAVGAVAAVFFDCAVWARGGAVTEEDLEVEGARRLLLVDFEDTAAAVAAEVLGGLGASLAGWTVVVVTRQALGVEGEVVVEVGALTPTDSVRLIRNHGALDPGSEPDEVVAALAESLGYLPLALELGAAWAAALGSAEVTRRVTDLLAGPDTRPSVAPGSPGERGGEDLRRLVTWSCDRLAESERRLLSSLSVFAGPFDLVAAEAVGSGPGVPAAAIPSSLAVLVRQSLVRRTGTSPATFQIAEPVRVSAQHPPGSEAAHSAADRHLSWALSLAAEADVQLFGPGQATWVRRLKETEADLAKALEWSADAGSDRAGLLLVAHLWRYWALIGRPGQGRAWIENRVEAGRDAVEPLDLAKALNGSANLATLQGDTSAARPLLEEALRIRREAGDLRGAASTLNDIGVMTFQSGDASGALERHREAMELYEEAGDDYGVATSSLNLANCAFASGDLATAAHGFQQTVTAGRRRSDPSLLVAGLTNLGVVMLRQNRPGAARDHLVEATETAHRASDRVLLCSVVDALSEALSAGGHPAPAAIVLGAGEALREESALPRPPGEQAEVDELRRHLRRELGEEFARHFGQRPSVDRLVAVAAAPVIEDEGAEAAPASGEATFTRQGDFWVVRRGEVAHLLKDRKGFRYLAALLRRPDAEIHVLDLVAEVEGGGAADDRTRRAVRASQLDAGLDRRAIAEYRRRIEELQSDIDDARAQSDTLRASAHQEELDFLVKELSGALGLGGRSRPAATDAAERARKAVSARLRDAVGAVTQVDPELGRHLDNAIRTGTFCSYRPDGAITLVSPA